MNRTPTQVRLKVLQEVSAKRAASAADLTWSLYTGSGNEGREYLSDLYRQWVTRMDRDSAWQSLKDEVGHERIQNLAFGAAYESLKTDLSVALTWTALRGWLYGDMIEVMPIEYRDDETAIIQQMRFALHLTGVRFLMSTVVMAMEATLSE